MINPCRPIKIGAFFLILLWPSLIGCGEAKQGKETEEVTNIEERIKEFREGKRFRGPVDEYIANGQPMLEVMNRLNRALVEEPDEVRKEVFRMIIALGKRIDPIFDKGGDLIRDRNIIGLLIDKGLSGQDEIRDMCLETLQQSVPGPILKDFAPKIVPNAQKWPDRIANLIIAKAKMAGAKNFIDSLCEKSAGAEDQSCFIAKAALGDTIVENDFIRKFQKTTDPQEKAQSALDLGYIGTKTALTALAGEMRTELVIEMPQVMRKSVRIFIVEALHYNYPEKSFLYDNAVGDDEGYARIEAFCEQEFGTVWKKERPPFLWIEGFETQHE